MKCRYWEPCELISTCNLKHRKTPDRVEEGELSNSPLSIEARLLRLTNQPDQKLFCTPRALDSRRPPKLSGYRNGPEANYFGEQELIIFCQRYMYARPPDSCQRGDKLVNLDVVWSGSPVPRPGARGGGDQTSHWQNSPCPFGDAQSSAI